MTVISAHPRSTQPEEKPFLVCLHSFGRAPETATVTDVMLRGGSRNFLRRGAPLRNDVTDR